MSFFGFFSFPSTLSQPASRSYYLILLVIDFPKHLLPSQTATTLQCLAKYGLNVFKGALLRPTRRKLFLTATCTSLGWKPSSLSQLSAYLSFSLFAGLVVRLSRLAPNRLGLGLANLLCPHHIHGRHTRNGGKSMVFPLVFQHWKHAYNDIPHHRRYSFLLCLWKSRRYHQLAQGR